MEQKQEEMVKKYQLIANGVIKVIFGNLLNLVNFILSNILIPYVIQIILRTTIAIYAFCQIIFGVFLIFMQFSKCEKLKKKLQNTFYLQNVELIFSNTALGLSLLYLMFFSNVYEIFISCLILLVLLIILTIIKIKENKVKIKEYKEKEEKEEKEETEKLEEKDENKENLKEEK